MQTASAASAVVEKTEMSNMSYPAHNTNIQHSAFSIQHSAFSIQHSALFPSDLVKECVGGEMLGVGFGPAAEFVSDVHERQLLERR